MLGKFGSYVRAMAPAIDSRSCTKENEMSSLEATLSALTQDFVERVTRALREDLASAASVAAKAPPAAPRGRPAAARPAKLIALPEIPPPSQEPKPVGARPGKRAAPPVAAKPVPKPPLPADIGAIVERILIALSDGPLLSEDLRAAVGVSRERLNRPLREALRRRQVVRHGERRLTTYTLP